MLYQVNLFYIISARATFFLCTILHLSGASAESDITRHHDVPLRQGLSQNKKQIKKQVEVLNLISLGATTFLRVKDSLKMQLLIENPSLITSPKLQNLAFWVSQVFDLFILQKNPCG